jgi:hypothetical protein
MRNKRTIKKAIKEKVKKWKGLVTFTSLEVIGEEAEKLEKMLSEAIDMPVATFEKHFAKLRSLCKVREYTFENQIVLVGREVFARRLINDLTYTGVINYGALGTSSTAISDAQTQLVAEVKRKGIATRSRTGDTVTVRFFYSKSDWNGTAEEFGTFIDATGTANSGQMFNRVLTGGWVKSALEALTVTAQFDLNPQ